MAIYLVEKGNDKSYCSSLLITKRLQQAQREFNLEVSKMIDTAAYGAPCYDDIKLKEGE